ncbi:transcriptional regulator, ArsR family [Malonomonas rubra DSM 5091]|jgi:ArsR family transcriptional regulator|uniref:Transcriptional regulator, ArsR family n=1 Tax=Malonomonas rubra DSM 5091 TaxID=1122189 RepID=A0A1M6JPL8_MALRU|nr:metalloregulator ArsR/SmtB family transcription factor [Malonomonas rubra]SHJ48586.1 transcriptional regulator, ArsR family [Malonomonas rubra DSM 5091]
MNQEICQVNLIHEECVAAAQQQMPQLATIEQLATVYKLLGEPSRLKIMLSLRTCEMCVCDLAAMLDSTPSAISHQLKLLRISGLVQSRKKGKMVYYSLAKNSVQQMLLEGLNYAVEKKA